MRINALNNRSGWLAALAAVAGLALPAVTRANAQLDFVTTPLQANTPNQKVEIWISEANTTTTTDTIQGFNLKIATSANNTNTLATSSIPNNAGGGFVYTGGNDVATAPVITGVDFQHNDSSGNVPIFSTNNPYNNNAGNNGPGGTDGAYDKASTPGLSASQVWFTSSTTTTSGLGYVSIPPTSAPQLLCVITMDTTGFKPSVNTTYYMTVGLTGTFLSTLTISGSSHLGFFQTNGTGNTVTASTLGQFTVLAAPEPGSLALLGVLAPAALLRRRRRTV